MSPIHVKARNRTLLFSLLYLVAIPSLLVYLWPTQATVLSIVAGALSLRALYRITMSVRGQHYYTAGILALLQGPLVLTLLLYILTFGQVPASGKVVFLLTLTVALTMELAYWTAWLFFLLDVPNRKRHIKQWRANSRPDKKDYEDLLAVRLASRTAYQLFPNDLGRKIKDELWEKYQQMQPS